MTGKSFWGVVIVVVLVGLIFGVIFARPYELQGSVIDPPAPAPDFDLISSQGGRYHLTEHNGKYRVLFFGYTACPDVCPAALFSMKQVVQRLDDLSEQIEIVFITVDPARDSQEQLGAYLKLIDKSFYGLTGEENDLKKVWKDYGVFVEIRDTGSAAGYLVDHSARLYVIDPNGNLVITYLSDMPVDDLVADLEYLIKRN